MSQTPGFASQDSLSNMPAEINQGMIPNANSIHDPILTICEFTSLEF
jgi:hypothetical protein